MKHGTPSAYNHGCRCEDCREANRTRCQDLRATLKRRTDSGDPAVPHGTTGGYKNWGCHCVECTAANTVASRVYYREQQELAEGVAAAAPGV